MIKENRERLDNLFKKLLIIAEQIELNNKNEAVKLNIEIYFDGNSRINKTPTNKIEYKFLI
jgi:hypothetical protein